MAPNKFKDKYNEKSMLEAVAEVNNKMLSQRQAADKYGVPQSTIADRVSGRYAPAILTGGQKRKLSKEQEKRLIKFMKYRARIGNGVTRPAIVNLIKDVLDKAERDSDQNFTNYDRLFRFNMPSKSWVHRFVTRHRDEVSVRTPEQLGHMRKKVSEKDLRDWFSNLENFLLSEHQIIAKDFFIPQNSQRIFNLDETGFPLAPGNKLKVVSEKGSKNVYNVSSESKDQITVLGCCSASGVCKKPFVIFPGIRPSYNLRQVNPDNYDVGYSPNGWISSDAFFGWFANLFYPSIKDSVEFPVIVFMDGHSTHINVAVAEFCRNNSIILFCFLPHASHIMQPLDISVYGPLKKYWNTAVNDFKCNYNQMMSKNCFFTVFNGAWDKCKRNMQNIISGFRKAGLIPYDPNAIDYSKLINEENAAREFNKEVPYGTAQQSLAFMRALKLFDKYLTASNIEQFRTRYSEGYDIDDRTDKGPR